MSARGVPKQPRATSLIFQLLGNCREKSVSGEPPVGRQNDLIWAGIAMVRTEPFIYAAQLQSQVLWAPPLS